MLELRTAERDAMRISLTQPPEGSREDSTKPQSLEEVSLNDGPLRGGGVAFPIPSPEVRFRLTDVPIPVLR